MRLVILCASLLVAACSSPAEATTAPSAVTIRQSDLTSNKYVDQTVRLTGRITGQPAYNIDFPDIMVLDDNVVVRWEAHETLNDGTMVEVIGTFVGDEDYPTVSGGTRTAPTIDATEGTVRSQ